MPAALSVVNNDIIRSQIDRKAVLNQAMSWLQTLNNLATLAPLPGLAMCLPIVITIIESIDVSSIFLPDICTLLISLDEKCANTNQENCFRLAVRATEILCAIINQTVERNEGISTGLNNALHKLAMYRLLFPFSSISSSNKFPQDS